jgi:hypothetical protein
MDKSNQKTVFVLDEFINIDRAASSQENIIVKENSGTFTLSCKVEAYPRKMLDITLTLSQNPKSIDKYIHELYSTLPV